MSRKLKILHFVAGDLNGGAARGAYWLHQGIQRLGVDSKVYSNSESVLDDNSVITLPRTKVAKLFNTLRVQLDSVLTLLYPKRVKNIFSTGLIGSDFTKLNAYKDADIIHLHWINSGFINIKHLSKIDKPIVWTMRDMWPMTGGCHYSMACDNFKTGCGNCLQLKSEQQYDLSRFINYRKKKYIPKNIKLVGISRWLTEQAKQSSLFKSFEITTISNAINPEVFKPIKPDYAKEVLGIKADKKIILVGSTNSKDDYKGFGKFIESLKFLDKERYLLCFFGRVDNTELKSLGIEYISLGYLHDTISLCLAYSSADVFVAPSIMEAFGKTLIESMACGTPVVCFDATGPKDIISHKIDGFKAIPFESEEMAKGIEWVTSYKNYSELSENARDKVLRKFNTDVIAKEYLAMYENLISDERE